MYKKKLQESNIFSKCIKSQTNSRKARVYQNGGLKCWSCKERDSLFDTKTESKEVMKEHVKLIEGIKSLRRVFVSLGDSRKFD